DTPPLGAATEAKPLGSASCPWVTIPIYFRLLGQANDRSHVTRAHRHPIRNAVISTAFQQKYV
ncbi:MAG TPA: hypothetical protein VKZ39_04885, partial [Sphaerochaetaceae bacterium]|nr:hypothetical protein [Sphaerochaetaceae bacterium]